MIRSHITHFAFPTVNNKTEMNSESKQIFKIPGIRTFLLTK